MKCRDLAPVLFVSAEPLLEGLELSPWLGEQHWWCPACFSEKSPLQVTFHERCTHCDSEVEWRGGIDWIIAGGESGPDNKRREMPMEALVSLHEQTAAAGVPLFVKQDSGRRPGQQGRIPPAIWNRKEFPQIVKA